MDFLNLVIRYLHEFNVVSILLRLILACIVGGLIGMERSKKGHAAGLRTHILVCLGSAIAAMTGIYVFKNVGGDATRISAQVISGIGFLGAGTILVKNETAIKGLTTAACVWAVGAIGIAVGYGFFLPAVVGALLIVFVTKTLNVVDKKIRHNVVEVECYIEFKSAKAVNKTLDDIKSFKVDIETITPSGSLTGNPGGIGAVVVFRAHKDNDMTKFISALNEMENIEFAILTEN